MVNDKGVYFMNSTHTAVWAASAFLVSLLPGVNTCTKWHADVIFNKKFLFEEYFECTLISRKNLS